MSPDLGTMLGDLLAARGAPAHAALVRRSAQLLCRERAQGHVCVDLDELARLEAEREGATDLPLPAPEAWRQALLQSGLASDGADGRPLPFVLDGERLYLRRDHAIEQRIVRAVRQRLAAPLAADPDDVAAALARVEGPTPAPAPDGEPDWQRAAVVAGAARRFLVLTGGPGTGKTTTIARLLAVLLALEPKLRVALAAPTGKAAARMGEAIAAHAERDPTLRTRLDDLTPRTLHRLLDYRPREDAFGRGAHRPLPFDVVVVDEVSMLDPALCAVLLEALPEQARLVLVGDRDQLAAVGSGQILGDLCRAAAPERGVGPQLAALVSRATGMQLPLQADAPPIADAVVALRTNHRFGQRPGLDAFAQALARREPERALAALAAGHADLTTTTAPDAALEAMQDELLAVAGAAAEDALATLGRLRILAATRHGDRGVQGWNRRVEALLRAHGWRTEDPWYPGRPILVVANDHQSRLFNGDLGVAARDPAGRPCVLFPGADGRPRRIGAYRLPAHETAWAMTVHKAQGSEFATVLLSMPEDDGPLWQAPLLYTGLTRARERALLLADPDRLAAGLATWPARRSGLYAAMAPA